MTRNVLRAGKSAALIVVQMVSGFIAGLLLLGLLPGDDLNFNVIGSLVMLVPAAVIFAVATVFRGREA